MKQGIVVKSTGSWYQVRNEIGDIVDCRIVGKIRLEDQRITNPIAVGDVVQYVIEDNQETGMISGIVTRKNYIVRQSPRKKHELHLLATNVDQAIVIVTIVEPKLKQGFIDRFLMMTEPYDIPTLIVFNKADLYSEADMELLEYLASVYEPLGYPFLLVSSLMGTGMDELLEHLQGKTTLIAGQSGVGKSSIINALVPNRDIRTQDLSNHSGKGQHTTTFAEMHFMYADTAIIDTPGIKLLSFNHFEPIQVAHNFREIFETAEQCRFGMKCLHKKEPGCAVKTAVEEDEISSLRYNNYLQILEEVEQQNYWERRTDL